MLSNCLSTAKGLCRINVCIKIIRRDVSVLARSSSEANENRLYVNM